MEDKTRHIESLFKEHYQAMYRLAFMMLHDEEESRDVVHDVFARLLDGDIRFDSGKAGAFLLSCVRNGCLNVMRSHDTRERAMRDYPIDDVNTSDSEAFENEIKALQNGISQLTPPVCREIILLHYRYGLTFKEIATRLQVSETTIYKHLRNALNQLRLTLRDTYKLSK
ncbi:MAG: sigma-70 family RNA polymerase sigma factor [Muribaculaceae bacterium]|nr:sigma-70 family RNA polymerase sigma factor [Muribaculaceae bacterium]